MKTLITAIVTPLLLPTLCIGQDADLKSSKAKAAVREYERTMEDVDKDYQKQLEDLEKSYQMKAELVRARLLSNLTAALEEEARKVNLEEANKIKGLIDEMKQEPDPEVMDLIKNSGTKLAGKKKQFVKDGIIADYPLASKASQKDIPNANELLPFLGGPARTFSFWLKVPDYSEPIYVMKSGHSGNVSLPSVLNISLPTRGANHGKVFKVYFSGTGSLMVDLKGFQFQKWNHVVVSIGEDVKNGVGVWINGQNKTPSFYKGKRLTLQRKIDRPIALELDLFKDPKQRGGMRNLRVYDRLLEQVEIETLLKQTKPN